MMIDLLIYLFITLASIFIGLFLGKNITKLKFEKKNVALEERNVSLNNSLKGVFMI